MSLHIAAKPGDIAETVLLAGDPLRARYIADTFLEDVSCYNELRAMYGYTGSYQGKRVSVQGSGMGMPSISIYANELIREYGVKRLIRVGSCGSLQPDVKLRDIVLAQTSCSNASANRRIFHGLDFAPAADFGLLLKAHEQAVGMELPVHVGNILSSDTFYDDSGEEWKMWARYQVLAVEMETAALYTLAARDKVQALTILTVSDSLVTGEEVPPADRENTFNDMARLALATI